MNFSDLILLLVCLLSMFPITFLITVVGLIGAEVCFSASSMLLEPASHSLMACQDIWCRLEGNQRGSENRKHLKALLPLKLKSGQAVGKLLSLSFSDCSIFCLPGYRWYQTWQMHFGNFSPQQVEKKRLQRSHLVTCCQHFVQPGIGLRFVFSEQQSKNHAKTEGEKCIFCFLSEIIIQ